MRQLALEASPKAVLYGALLLAIGALFLWRNLHPEAPVFDMLAQYWPFVLIAWGLLRLIEGLKPAD